MNTTQLKNALLEVAKKFWIEEGVRFGQIQTMNDLKGKSSLTVFDKNPNTEFKVLGVTLRTRGYNMFCELDIQIKKADGTFYNNPSVYGSIHLGSILQIKK